MGGGGAVHANLRRGLEEIDFLSSDIPMTILIVHKGKTDHFHVINKSEVSMELGITYPSMEKVDPRLEKIGPDVMVLLCRLHCICQN